MPNFEPHFEPDVTLWILTASCISGLMASLLMRKSEGSSLHGLFVGMFYTSMLAVGFTAICFIGAPSGLSLFPPMTLGVMIVAATWDFQATPVESF